MSYRYERRQQRRSGRGCLAWLVALVWIVLLAMLAYRFLFRQQVSQFIGRQIGEQLRGNVEAPPGQQIEQGAQQVLPTVVAALPSGELHVSEQDANNYLAANAASLSPIQSATVAFVPGELRADITAAGTTSTLRSGLAVQNGRIIAVSPRLDGVLGQFIAVEELTGSLERQLNDQLATQGRRVTDVRIEQGELIITIEG
jgi:hypothetical protein